MQRYENFVIYASSLRKNKRGLLPMILYAKVIKNFEYIT